MLLLFSLTHIYLHIADKSQSLVKELFTKNTPDEFWLKVIFSNTTPSFFIPQVTKKEWKEYQNSEKKQNMKDLCDRRKVKDIVEGK